MSCLLHCGLNKKKIFLKNYKICLQSCERAKKGAQTDSQSMFSVPEQCCRHKTQQLTLDRFLKAKKLGECIKEKLFCTFPNLI